MLDLIGEQTSFLLDETSFLPVLRGFLAELTGLLDGDDSHESDGGGVSGLKGNGKNSLFWRILRLRLGCSSASSLSIVEIVVLRSVSFLGGTVRFLLAGGLLVSSSFEKYLLIDN